MPFVDLNTDVKPWLGIDVSNTNHDSVLTLIRDSVENAVLNYTEAKFSLTVVTNEILDSNSSDVIITRHTPIDSVQQVLFGVNTDGSNGELVDSDNYYVDQNSIIFQGSVRPPRGRAIIRVDYTYGFDGLPADVKEAILLAIEAKFRRKGRKSIGTSGRSKKDESESYRDILSSWDSRVGLPKEVVWMLNPYRVNFEFPIQPMATRNP